MKRRIISEHQSSDCPKQIIDCDDCKQEILREQMPQHAWICPEKIIPCTYNVYGCRHKGKRVDLDQHLVQHKERHLILKV